MMYEEQGPFQHPYLREPLLYVSQVPQYVTDSNLAAALVTCSPFRLNISRDGSSMHTQGTIQFKRLEEAEKALTTLQSRALPEVPTVALVLSPYPPTNPPTPLPPPLAIPRLINGLPSGYTDSQLYDLFRPFGALASVRTQASFGQDTAVIEFWSEDDACAAEEALHCADVEGQNIAVQVYMPQPPRRHPSEFSINAPAFIPGAVFSPHPNQYSPTYSPTRASPFTIPGSLGPAPFHHGPGQQVQLAPPIGPGSSSQSGLIDPCNLFCKNLDPAIDSNGLFAHFRSFGQIVSARVMRNETGESRGFGFVSYQTPDQANAALSAMNGVTLGSKAVIVRLHEPKQLRQEKLAHRFSGHNGHPRSVSGATSPTASEYGDSIAGWGSPRHGPSALAGSPDRHDRGRRGSGSYYNAALSGNLNVPIRYDELSALTPVVRKEVLKGELSRQIKALSAPPPSHDMEAIVNSLVGLSLSEVIQVIHDPTKLAERVERVRLAPSESPTGSKSPSPSNSADSRLLLEATASAPEHPSTPVSISPSLSTPPRTESPSGSILPASATERERIAAAISKIETDERIQELTELLMSLPKRERAMCMFNVEVLRAKIADAKTILDLDDDEEEERPAPAPVPRTPRKAALVESQPQTPELSSRGPSAAASPVPVTPGGPSAASGGGYTPSSLAKLPAAEIIRIARSKAGPGFALEKEDPLVVKATDEFVDGLMDKSVQSQKQLLGEKLWRAVKAFGIKGAPKLTITLLDQDDLRSLAHLMNSYPTVLKEKALLAQTATASR